VLAPFCCPKSRSEHSPCSAPARWRRAIFRIARWPSAIRRGGCEPVFLNSTCRTQGCPAQNTIPINDPVRLYRRLQPEIDAAIAQAVASGRWIDGVFTERFANRFAAWCGVARCVPLGNGTDALELALRAVGAGPGDEVMTVANAGGFATAACRLVGATPVWIDVRGDTLGLDTDWIAEAISERTKVVIATHLYGIVVDVAEIRRVLGRIGRSDVRILEDCAQAHGATRDRRRVGSLGDIAAFSFYPTKNLGALGDAGAVVTNDEELADRVNWLRRYGYRKYFEKAVPFGRNSRIDEIQAAVLCVKLEHVDEWNAERRAIVSRYAEAVRRPAAIVGHSASFNVCHLAVLRTPGRDAVQRAMAQAGIATAIHYPVLDCDQVSESGLPARKLPLSVSERARGGILSLPCYPSLTQQEVERVGEALTKLQD
jgi:dTDP-3-amino-2,3,6-trideoxy-4-keto-D-glucose/dTDP-3-amino-3,4,6-trideoxy-alpha-D-glucose/dTDP-2,6-dideoxy-D-kanosamine transaminase